MSELKTRNVRATGQPITSTSAGKAFIDLQGVFARFETNLQRERQLEGNAAAKARGVYKGQQAQIDPSAVRHPRDQEKLNPSAIAKRLGSGCASGGRVLGQVA